MKRTIRNLVIAAPLATAALTVVPAAATATEPGPVIVIQPTQPDPEPQPKGPQDKAPAPKPQQPKGPQDKAPAPKPQQPKGPQDKAPAPKPQQPKGPGDITNPQPTGPKPGGLVNPQPCGSPCTSNHDARGGSQVGSGSGGHDAGTGGREDVRPLVTVADTAALPTQIDAELATEESDGGLDIAWLFAGGLAVTASGVAFAARRRAQSRA